MVKMMQTKEKPSSQFPAKYGQLPAIPSPTPGANNQVVPFNGAGGRPTASVTGMRASADLMDAQEKVQFLESRLGVTEKSNRALLEEVLRLQNELRTSVNKNEFTLREERNARQQMESSHKMLNDLIMQLATRIKSTEDKILEEKSALSTLVTHTKGVEQAVLTSQNELRSKKDSQMNRIAELQGTLVDTQRSKDQLEKQVLALNDELRGIRGRMDSQNQEFQTVANDLRMRSKRLEEENKAQLENLRKQGDIQTQTNSSTTHLRGQVETRLSEIRDVILDLRTRQDQEATDRRSLEQVLQVRVNELNQQIAEQNRKREESMHALDMIAREKEHAADAERMKQQAKLSEISEDFNKRLLTKEIKLREEIQDKHVQLEKVVQHEQASRKEYERRAREELESQYQNLKRTTDSDIQALRELLKNDRTKSKETLLKLNDAITLLEKQMNENKKQVDKVITAEIKSRKEREKKTDDKMESLQEKLAVATVTLQQAIGGVTTQLTDHQEKVRVEVKDMLKEQDKASARAMTDMDAKLRNMTKKVSYIEGTVDTKVNRANADLTENLRDKVSSITLWQEVTSQTIRELNSGLQAIPNDVTALEEKQRLMKSDLAKRLTLETDNRIRDIDNIRDELQVLKNRKPSNRGQVSSSELDTMQQSVRKLAESIQTVKTVLGMKIQSEQKLRMSALEELQSQISEIKTVLANNPHIRWHPSERRPVSSESKVKGFDSLMKTDLEEAIVGNGWAITQRREGDDDDDDDDDDEEGEERGPRDERSRFKGERTPSDSRRKSLSKSRQTSSKDDPTTTMPGPPDDADVTNINNDVRLPSPLNRHTDGYNTPKSHHDDGDESPITRRDDNHTPLSGAHDRHGTSARQRTVKSPVTWDDEDETRRDKVPSPDDRTKSPAGRTRTGTSNPKTGNGGRSPNRPATGQRSRRQSQASPHSQGEGHGQGAGGPSATGPQPNGAGNDSLQDI